MPLSSTVERVLRRGRSLRRGRRGTQVLAGFLAVGFVAAGAWAGAWTGLHGHRPAQAVAADPGPIQGQSAPVGFPASLYPQPVAPTGAGSVSFPGKFTCPSLSGVQTPGTGAAQGALGALNSLLHAPNKTDARAFADRAAWPLISSGFAPLPDTAQFPATDVSIRPAAKSTYAANYQKLCGAALVNDSLVALWCTSTTTRLPLPPSTCLSKQPAITNSSFFLDRRGHWLLWGLQGA